MENSEAIAAGRKLLLEIGGNCEESWQQSDKPFECAAQLADALAQLVGYPQWDEETGGYSYPPDQVPEANPPTVISGGPLCHVSTVRRVSQRVRDAGYPILANRILTDEGNLAICGATPVLNESLAAPPVLVGVESAMRHSSDLLNKVIDHVHLTGRDYLMALEVTRSRDSAIASAARLEGERAGRFAVLDKLERAAGGVVGRAGLLDYVRELRSKLTDTGGSDG